MNDTVGRRSLLPPFMADALDNWTYLMTELKDPRCPCTCTAPTPRADSYPLMSSIWPTLAICLGYVYFVKVLGPR